MGGKSTFIRQVVNSHITLVGKLMAILLITCTDVEYDHRLWVSGMSLFNWHPSPHIQFRVQVPTTLLPNAQNIS